MAVEALLAAMVVVPFMVVVAAGTAVVAGIGNPEVFLVGSIREKALRRAFSVSNPIPQAYGELMR
jgi:hypothetical protein